MNMNKEVSIVVELVKENMRSIVDNIHNGRSVAGSFSCAGIDMRYHDFILRHANTNDGCAKILNVLRRAKEDYVGRMKADVRNGKDMKAKVSLIALEQDRDIPTFYESMDDDAVVDQWHS